MTFETCLPCLSQHRGGIAKEELPQRSCSTVPLAGSDIVPNTNLGPDSVARLPSGKRSKRVEIFTCTAAATPKAALQECHQQSDSSSSSINKDSMSSSSKSGIRWKKRRPLFCGWTSAKPRLPPRGGRLGKTADLGATSSMEIDTFADLEVVFLGGFSQFENQHFVRRIWQQTYFWSGTHSISVG